MEITSMFLHCVGDVNIFLFLMSLSNILVNKSNFALENANQWIVPFA